MVKISEANAASQVSVALYLQRFQPKRQRAFNRPTLYAISVHTVTVANKYDPRQCPHEYAPVLGDSCGREGSPNGNPPDWPGEIWRLGIRILYGGCWWGDRAAGRPSWRWRRLVGPKPPLRNSRSCRCPDDPPGEPKRALEPKSAPQSEFGRIGAFAAQDFWFPQPPALFLLISRDR